MQGELVLTPTKHKITHKCKRVCALAMYTSGQPALVATPLLFCYATGSKQQMAFGKHSTNEIFEARVVGFFPIPGSNACARRPLMQRRWHQYC